MCAGKAGFERSKRFFDLNETIPQKKSFNNQNTPIKNFTIVTKITTLPAPDTHRIGRI